MNPAAVLSLIEDLYTQLVDARARIAELELVAAAQPPTAEPALHTTPADLNGHHEEWPDVLPKEANNQ